MDHYEIRVTVSKDGKVTAEVRGVEGPQCQELSAFLNALGKVEIDIQTPDYRKQPRQGLIIRR